MSAVLHPPATPAVYAALAMLLEYPNEQQLQSLSQLYDHLSHTQLQQLQPLLDYLTNQTDLIELQEEYVNTFDRRPKHSLHLFEHVHGTSRDRGQAMVDLHEEYQRYGLYLNTSELPDYVPLFLEFLAQIPSSNAQELLGDAVHVLAKLGEHLQLAQSPYACVFVLLEQLSPVAAEPLPDMPEEELEEEEVSFGPHPQGMAATLKHAGLNSTPQPVHFYDASVLRSTSPKERL